MAFSLLICDDERRIREGLRYAVDWSSIGINKIGTAADGLEGWEWVCENQPELIITDIRMPRMDGLELLNKTMNAFPYTIVILLTGYEDFNYAQQALRYRAFDYLLKPTNPETVINVCKDAMKNLTHIQHQVLLQETMVQDSKGMVDHIIRYVRDQYAANISLESAANEIHVSTVHLNRLMKKEIGLTFLEYLTHIRIEKAKQLLLHSKHNVYEICYLVGYRDPKYFSQLFRKITGSKPSEYSTVTRRSPQ